MDDFSAADVATLITLMAEASDPIVGPPAAARQRKLINALQSVLSADAWLWFTGEFHSLTAASNLSSGLLYEGFQDEQDPLEIFQVVCRPAVRRAFTSRPHPCYAHEELPKLIELERVNGFDHCSARTRACDAAAGDYVTVLNCSLSDGTYCGVSFHRQRGNALFTRRERMLAEMLFTHVEWLHSAPIETCPDCSLDALSRREREVMNLLLSGKSRKEVAQHLTLSIHTVGDYLKKIYAKLDVCSRAELLARFIPGNRES